MRTWRTCMSCHHLQAWAGAYRGGRPPTACYYYYYYYYTNCYVYISKVINCKMKSGWLLVRSVVDCEALNYDINIRWNKTDFSVLPSLLSPSLPLSLYLSMYLCISMNLSSAHRHHNMTWVDQKVQGGRTGTKYTKGFLKRHLLNYKRKFDVRIDYY